MPFPDKRFSQACENNKRFILDRINDQFLPGSTVLEIGSRTAQHVTFFAQMLPQVRWLPSDTPENMATLIECLDGHQGENITGQKLIVDAVQNETLIVFAGLAEGFVGKWHASSSF